MRAPRLLVAAVLLALGVTVLVAPAPASAVVRTLDTIYKCDDGNGHTGKARVHVRVDLPRRVHQGTRIPDRRIRVRLRVPASITSYLRDSVHARSIEGSAPNAYYRIAAKQIPIRHLHVPETEIPESGALVLHARGRAEGHRFRRLGPVGVFVGRGFTTQGTVYGGLAGSGTTYTLGCELPLSGVPRKIATIRVVR